MAADSTNTALLTEHFRYTPLTLLDDIINTVNELVFRAVNAIEDGFGGTTAEQLGFRLDPSTAATLPSPEARHDALVELKQNEIDNGIVKLESLLNATVDKDFDKFEIYVLRNILAVGHEEDGLADWVRLEHYQGVDLVDAENVPTPEAVQMQRTKLHETVKLNTMLRAEEARNEAVLKQLRGWIGTDGEGTSREGGAESAKAPLAFLQALTRREGERATLTVDTEAALEHIPALRRLLKDLRDAMETVAAAKKSGAGQHEDGAEARRRRYLEKQSRRALERKGIDPDSSAGASLAAGRKMGTDELEGISSVVQALQDEDGT
jgi:kinetochore protein Mis12/MTW1